MLVASGPPLRTAVGKAWVGLGAAVAPVSLQARRTGPFRDGGLGPGASPHAAACGRGGALNPQRPGRRPGRALGHGGPRPGPGQCPRSSQSGGSGLDTYKGDPLWAKWAGEQDGRWFLGMGGPGRCQQVAGRAHVALGRRVPDLPWFVGEAPGAWGHCWGRRVQGHFTCSEAPKNQSRAGSPRAGSTR